MFFVESAYGTVLCIAYNAFVCLQPFYCNLVESVKAFVQVEQDSLRANLEQLARKFEFPFVVEVVFALIHAFDCEPHFTIHFR